MLRSIPDLEQLTLVSWAMRFASALVDLRNDQDEHQARI